MSRKKQGLIGVFDSGFGGLEILRYIVKKLPQYSYIYLGDSARAPYGARSQSTVLQFTRQAVDFLFKQGCYLVILACNTASSEALRKIQQEYLPKRYPKRRVLGVIIPAVEEAVLQTCNNRVGVIATDGTVRSGAFAKEIKKLDSAITVLSKACPLLVPIIEAGEHNSKIADLAVEKYLKSFLKQRVDVLVLGCTHYGLLEKKISNFLGKKVKLIVEGKIVADKLVGYLGRHPEIEKDLVKGGGIKFLTTDLADKFETLGSKFFGKKIKVSKVKLV